VSFKNKEAEKAYGAKYRAENAAREKERKAKWYRANRAEIAKRRKERALANAIIDDLVGDD
jgi:hypothetical protein